MMSADVLARSARGSGPAAEGWTAARQPEVVAALVGRIEADVEEYRARFLVDRCRRTPVPPRRSCCR